MAVDDESAGEDVWKLRLTKRRGDNPWRLLELAAVALLFVGVLQPREIRMSLGQKGFK